MQSILRDILSGFNPEQVKTENVKLLAENESLKRENKLLKELVHKLTKPTN
jgi:cell division protein FtsB